MKKRAFLKNAAILTVTSLLLKTIGIFFRVYLSNKIGAEGIGLYQLIFSVYVLGSTFASSGIHTATTRLVTDELVCGTKKSVRQVLRRAILLSLTVAAASTLLFYFGAPLIGTYWIKDTRAIPALRVLSFAFPFMGISNCIKGYFVARRRVGSSSRAQILEQLSRIAIILVLIDRFSALGLTAACLAVMIGDTISEAISCGYMVCSYYWDRRRVTIERTGACIQSRGGVVRRLLSIAVPITAGKYLGSGLRTIENVMVPNKLTVYTGARDLSLSQFGALKGMAMPLIFFPSSFLNAFSTLLVPEMSEARALGQKRRVMRTVDHTLHITLLASILVGGLFWLLADPLADLIYSSAEVAFYLKVLAPLVPVMYLESVVDGILRGLNQQISSLKYSVADSAIRILLIFFLLPLWGMKGFLLIMVFSNFFTCGLNVHRLLKVSGTYLRWGKWVFRPLLCVAIGVAGCSLLGKLPAVAGLPNLAVILLFGILTAGVYLLLLPLLGCISRDDIRLKA